MTPIKLMVENIGLLFSTLTLLTVYKIPFKNFQESKITTVRNFESTSLPTNVVNGWVGFQRTHFYHILSQVQLLLTKKNIKNKSTPRPFVAITSFDIIQDINIHHHLAENWIAPIDKPWRKIKKGSNRNESSTFVL